MVTSLQSQLHTEREKNQSGLSTVHWFTQEIDQLRSRIAALEQENHTLRSAQASLSTLAEMRAENARLKADLLAVNARLSSIQSLIAGNAPTPLESKPTAVLTPASASDGSLPVETYPPTSVSPTSRPPLAIAPAISLDADTRSFDRNPDTQRFWRLIVLRSTNIIVNLPWENAIIAFIRVIPFQRSLSCSLKRSNECEDYVY